MPWYRRRYRWRPTWRRRRNRFWKRTRRTLQYGRYRRRRRVRKRKFRKRKLKKIVLKQFQPQTIKKVKVKGIDCLFECNKEKIYFNYQMYETSTVPEHLPGGGGWSCKVWSLSALYDAFKHCRNVWTGSNHNLPLVRYLGCKYKLYQSHTQDYTFKYQNHFPMVATMESYNAAQPSMLMMDNRTKKIPSKTTKQRRKPYTIVRIKPPAQMQNKWYFAHDISHTPLLLTYASACSFDNYFISTKSLSDNCNIILLRTGIFNNTNFQNKGNNPYSPTTAGTQQVYLYATAHNKQSDNSYSVKDLILLGNTSTNTGGFAYSDAQKPISNWNEMTSKAQLMWGNPFYKEYISNTGTYTIMTSTVNWASLINKGENGKLSNTEYTEVDALYETIRYSPNRDNGEGNMCYFKPVNKHENSWDPPADQSLVNHGFPLWILLWGYSDFIKRTEKYKNLETDYALVFTSPHTTPPRTKAVMLNHSFIIGNSPFENEFNILDYNRWHPCLQMQYTAINQICETGPGTPKLGDRKTTEAKAQYTFYFKFGGNPPKMSEIEDPGEQHSYPIPNNLIGRTTIESPTEPIHTFLYNFDTKRDILTTKAAKRITKDYETKKSLFTDGTNPKQEEIYYPQKKKATEKEKEALQSIIEQLQQQHILKRRINQQLMWHQNT
nr:MAG: ORF1 [TTV-like mini virus]